MQRRTFLLSSAAAVLSPLATLPAMAAVPPAVFHAARRYQDLKAGNVAYVECGRGDAALFLHGFPLNSYQWRDVMAQLAPLRRCIAPDFLGLGHSVPARGQDVSPPGQMAMLLQLMDRLGVRQADVVANDSGGAIAQLLLAHHPERVRSLLLTNCDTEIDCPPSAMAPVIDMADAGTFAGLWFTPWLADKDRARAAQGLGGLCYEHPQQLADSTIEAYLRPLVATPAATAHMHRYAAALRANALAGIGPALRASRVPVRVAWGMADTTFLPHGAAHLEQAFGNLRGIRRLENSKLFWPEERPDVVAHEARQLWQA